MFNPKLKVCIAGRNCEKFIERCFNSISQQSYTNFDLISIDDNSSDETYEKMNLYKKDNWKIIKNSERIGALNNIVNAINLHNCTDEDVIVLIDADDWLATSDAFQILVKYYREGAKATYGSRIVGKDIEVPEGPENISRDWRSNRGNLIHLHTFMFEIYKHINHDVSFIDKETKKYYTSAHDRVIMTNIAELAGSSIRRISEAVYAYNNVNMLSDGYVNRPEQKRIDSIVKNQASYFPLF